MHVGEAVIGLPLGGGVVFEEVADRVTVRIVGGRVLGPRLLICRIEECVDAASARLELGNPLDLVIGHCRDCQS
jgi:hypothetical protein